jgi:hypothetical protein
MKDIVLTQTKTGVSVIPQTVLAKKVFQKESEEFTNGFEVANTEAHKILSWAISHNLSIDSKVAIIIPERPRLTREQLQKVFPALPATFLPRQLFAIGTAKFKGDVFGKSEQTKSWSVNDQFDKGIEYPVYEYEGLFVVGKDGKGYKMTPASWTKIKPN